MKTKMKQHEIACHEFSKKYKSWELICTCNDSYLAGVRFGRSQVLNKLELILDESTFNFLKEEVEKEANRTIEVEFKDGEHQLGFHERRKNK